MVRTRRPAWNRRCDDGPSHSPLCTLALYETPCCGRGLTAFLHHLPPDQATPTLCAKECDRRRCPRREKGGAEQHKKKPFKRLSLTASRIHIHPSPLSHTSPRHHRARHARCILRHCDRVSSTRTHSLTLGSFLARRARTPPSSAPTRSPPPARSCALPTPRRRSLPSPPSPTHQQRMDRR